MKSILISIFAFSFSSLFAQTDTLPSGVYTWANATVQQNAGRESRSILRGSTLDLASLSVHASTLSAGSTNHPPVAYDDREELIVVKEGQLKAMVNGTTKLLGPGSILLIVAGDEQSFQNTSEKPVTYYVIAFRAKVPVNIQRGRDAGRSLMKSLEELEVKQTDKGESRPVFDRPSSLFERFDVHATSLNPGIASHPPHTHRAEEIILMLKGSVEVQIGNEFIPAVAGDVIFYNSMKPHAVKNNGKEQNGYYAIQWHVRKGD